MTWFQILHKSSIYFLSLLISQNAFPMSRYNYCDNTQNYTLMYRLLVIRNTFLWRLAYPNPCPWLWFESKTPPGWPSYALNIYSTFIYTVAVEHTVSYSPRDSALDTELGWWDSSWLLLLSMHNIHLAQLQHQVQHDQWQQQRHWRRKRESTEISHHFKIYLFHNTFVSHVQELITDKLN